MNGPLTMYKLQPVVHFPHAVELSNTMYRMKNIYSSNVSSVGVNQDNSTLPNILEQKQPSEKEDLKNRQEAILKQLTHLKHQMLALREELGKKNSNLASSSKSLKQMDLSPSLQGVAREPSWNGLSGEAVLHASPDHPPYSLLVVSQLWSGLLRLQVTCHAHSSVMCLPPHLALFSSLSPSTASPSLHLRLIWKQMGPDCELVLSPVSHCPIRGEVNVLRYLHRSMGATSDVVSETRLDATLDLCHRLRHARTVRDRLLAVRALNARLGKAEWLGGADMSVADVAAWSVLRSVTGVDLSQNMSRWLARCCAVAGVDAA